MGLQFSDVTITTKTSGIRDLDTCSKFDRRVILFNFSHLNKVPSTF